jgi:hypothetical protein
VKQKTVLPRPNKKYSTITQVSSAVPSCLRKIVEFFEFFRFSLLLLFRPKLNQDGKRSKFAHGDGDELRRGGDQEVGQTVQEVGHRQLGITLRRGVHDTAGTAAEPARATGHRYI